MNNKINKNSYDMKPFLYDIRGFFILTLAYRNTLNQQTNFFSENFKGVHLECATGTGTFSKMCFNKSDKNKVKKLYAVDYSEALMSGASKKLKGYELKIEDLCNMSFKNEYFDSINLANSFHTIDKIEEAISEIKRVLKPEGTFYLNILLPPKNGVLDKISKKVNDYGQKKGILNRAYTKEESFELLNKQGFVILDNFEIENGLFIKAKKPIL